MPRYCICDNVYGMGKQCDCELDKPCSCEGRARSLPKGYTLDNDGRAIPPGGHHRPTRDRGTMKDIITTAIVAVAVVLVAALILKCITDITVADRRSRVACVENDGTWVRGQCLQLGHPR